MNKVPLGQEGQMGGHAPIGFEGPPPPYNQNFDGQQSPQFATQFPAQGVTANVMTTTVVIPLALGPQPARMQCPHCHADISTRTEKEPSSKAWLSGIIILLLGGLCCACIPCCMDDCQDTKHNCPNCKAYLGKYQP